jgi:hypothetical protein
MSFQSTAARPYARGVWGNRSSWRGNQQNAAAPQWGIGNATYRASLGAQGAALSGVTRDNAGAALGNCVVDLMRSSDDAKIAAVTSDASGNFAFYVLPPGPYYLVAYKVGSPDVAGTTVNTLTPTAL